MARKPATLRRSPNSYVLPNSRGGPPEIDLGSLSGGNGKVVLDAKLVKRYVAWLRQATPKQRRVFIDRFIDGLLSLPAKKAVDGLMQLKLLVNAVGPVPRGHELVCVADGHCTICEEMTVTARLSNNICCTRGPDQHSVVFN